MINNALLHENSVCMLPHESSNQGVSQRAVLFNVVMVFK